MGLIKRRMANSRAGERIDGTGRQRIDHYREEARDPESRKGARHTATWPVTE